MSAPGWFAFGVSCVVVLGASVFFIGAIVWVALHDVGRDDER